MADEKVKISNKAGDKVVSRIIRSMRSNLFRKSRMNFSGGLIISSIAFLKINIQFNEIIS